MPFFVYIAFLILAVIFWQDLRSRAIWWFLPPLLFASFILLKWSGLDIVAILLNMAFVTMMIGLLTIYARFRFGKLENPFKSYFGLGDYLYLLALTPLFPLQGFIWFFTAGTIIVLMVHLVVMLFSKDRTIPYAGYFSLFTAFYLVMDACIPQFFQLLNHRYG